MGIEQIENLERINKKCNFIEIKRALLKEYNIIRTIKREFEEFC